MGIEEVRREDGRGTAPFFDLYGHRYPHFLILEEVSPWKWRTINMTTRLFTKNVL
jgi:hypothetical protein